MKIVFMGTPDFAVGALEALLCAGHTITLVVTQPDKAKGRSGQLQFSPVKECAVKHGLPVLQPTKIKAPEAVEALKGYEADVFVVAAFGQILSGEILDMPRYGCLNIHASLLPKYRGSSPIQRAIIDGEKVTGVTIQQMDEGVDTGDILFAKETTIADDDTFETLHDKLMVLGREAIVETLSLLEEGKLTPKKQDDSLSCRAPLIDKSMGRIDFGRRAAEIDRQIRGMTPWPSAYTFYHGKQLKIWKAQPSAENAEGGEGQKKLPGTVLEVTKDCISVLTGEGSLKIYELQLEGKKRMTAHDFLLGVKVQPGEMLG